MHFPQNDQDDLILENCSVIEHETYGSFVTGHIGNSVVAITTFDCCILKIDLILKTIQFKLYGYNLRQLNMTNRRKCPFSNTEETLFTDLSKCLHILLGKVEYFQHVCNKYKKPTDELSIREECNSSYQPTFLFTDVTKLNHNKTISFPVINIKDDKLMASFFGSLYYLIKDLQQKTDYSIIGLRLTFYDPTRKQLTIFNKPSLILQDTTISSYRLNNFSLSNIWHEIKLPLLQSNKFLSNALIHCTFASTKYLDQLSPSLRKAIDILHRKHILNTEDLKDTILFALMKATYTQNSDIMLNPLTQNMLVLIMDSWTDNYFTFLDSEANVSNYGQENFVRLHSIVSRIHVNDTTPISDILFEKNIKEQLENEQFSEVFNIYINAWNKETYEGRCFIACLYINISVGICAYCIIKGLYNTINVLAFGSTTKTLGTLQEYFNSTNYKPCKRLLDICKDSESDFGSSLLELHASKVYKTTKPQMIIGLTIIAERILLVLSIILKQNKKIIEANNIFSEIKTKLLNDVLRHLDDIDLVINCQPFLSELKKQITSTLPNSDTIQYWPHYLDSELLNHSTEVQNIKSWIQLHWNV